MNVLASIAFLFLLSSPIVSSESVCAANKQCNQMEEKDGLSLLQTNSKLLEVDTNDEELEESEDEDSHGEKDFEFLNQAVSTVLSEAGVKSLSGDDEERIVTQLRKQFDRRAKKEQMIDHQDEMDDEEDPFEWSATRAGTKELVDQILMEARVHHITEDERERIVSELESKSVSIEESMSNKKGSRRRAPAYRRRRSGETSSRPGGPPSRVGGFGRGRR